MKLLGKTLLLTFADTGLGPAVARALAAKGAFLLLSGSAEPALNSLHAEIGTQHSRVVTGAIDTEAGRVQLIETCRGNERPVDGVICHGPDSRYGLYRATSQATIEQFVRQYLLGPILLIRGLIPQLVDRPAALIVTIGTLPGSIGLPGFATAASAGFGLRGFSEALKRELIATGVKSVYITHRGIARVTPGQGQRPRPGQTTSAGSAGKPEVEPKVEHAKQIADAVIKAMEQEQDRTLLNRRERWWTACRAISPKVVEKSLQKHLSSLITTSRKGPR